ncbi:hypothetical protein ACK37E_10630, partial [Aeromonas veronii]
EGDGGDQITKSSVSSIQAASIWETTPRSSNNKQQTWSGQIRAILGKESRPFMLGFLQSRGFNLK